VIKNYRLPKSLKPYYYDITTLTSFDSLTEPEKYDGKVEIHFVVNQRTNLIVFHQSDLIIDSSSIIVMPSSGGSGQINVLKVSYDEETSFFTVNLAEMLENGQNYSIKMDYEGKLLSNNEGFYKGSYTDAQGRKRLMKL
jgi:hypothetical protein